MLLKFIEILFEYCQRRPDDVRKTSGRRTSGRRPDDVRTTSGRRPDDVRTTSKRRPDDVRTTSGQRPDHVRTKSGRRLDDVRTTSGRRPDDVRTTTGGRYPEYLVALLTKGSCLNPLSSPAKTLQVLATLGTQDQLDVQSPLSCYALNCAGHRMLSASSRASPTSE